MAGRSRPDSHRSLLSSRAGSRERMAKETPIELQRALDCLVDALDSARDLRLDTESAVSETLHECAEIARRLNVTPEELLHALKPRLARVAARAPAESREAYLRAITTLAVDAFIRGR